LKAEGEERQFKPESQIGKTVVVTKESLAKDISAFYCDVCKLALPDSTAWYDHINGKKHNRMKGMSMVV
jgi:U4/U6.U5 tri-snRNP component SNU23